MLKGGHEANPAPLFAWDTLLGRASCKAEGESGLGMCEAVDGTQGLSPESPNIADTTLCGSPSGSWALSCAWPARPCSPALSLPLGVVDFPSLSAASLVPGQVRELCEF